VRIGIIGAGNIGGTLARLLAAAGHDVALSNSRGPASLAAAVDEINRAAGGPRARAATVTEAASYGELVVLAVPWRTAEALPAAEELAGKIVVDAMNPYAADGGILDLGGSSSSEETAVRLRGARIVKAFNTIYWRELATGGRSDLPLAERRAIPIAGDDAPAKAAVTAIVEELGFAAVDVGDLASGRRQEPGSPIYNVELTPAEVARALSL
jgi:predicted dinucleotide-binding enzyme